MTRQLEHMRYPQVQAYLERSDAIILPVGTTEVHGPHLPYGTDKLIAQAGAVLAAEKADSLVAPAFSYTWSGATRSLPGTLTLPVETVIPLVRQLCLACIEQGFRRIAVLSAHGPDSWTLGLAVRSVYEQTGVAPISFNLFSDTRGLKEPVVAEMAAREAASPSFQETSMLLAALKILSIEGAADMSAEPLPETPYPAGLDAVSRTGATAGFYYSDASQHVPMPGSADAVLGRRYLEAAADAVAAALEALKTYGPEAEKQAFSWQRLDR